MMYRVLVLLTCLAISHCCKKSKEPEKTAMEEKGNKKILNKKVIIIGGGAAGIATAERLERGGETDFLILEATRRVGGRVRSESVGQGGGRVEFGAQYIHGVEGNVVYEMAEKWGMVEPNEEEDEEDAAYMTKNGKTIKRSIIDKIEEVMENIETNLEEKNSNDLKNYSSVGDFFTTSLHKKLQTAELEKYRSEALQYLELYGKVENTDWGSASLYDVAADGNTRYQECPGNQGVTFKQNTNYQDLIEKYGASVLDKVVLGERVTAVRQHSDDMVEVETASTVYQCQYAVVTVSLGVLKNELIHFTPNLPADKRSAIASIGFGVVAKVFLEYEADPWTLDPDMPDDGFYFLREEGELGNPWRNLPSSPWQDGFSFLWTDQYHLNPKILTAWFTGPAALKVESLPQSSLLTAMTSLLGSYLTSSHPLAHPISATSTTWGTENTTLGSYSFPTPATPPSAPAALARPLGRILWAGEATHSTHWSTVHGAIETGWREAERILGY